MTLLSSMNFYIEKFYCYARDWANNDFINSENYDDNLLVLTGKAGIEY